MTISDIIDAKERLTAHWNSPEYINTCKGLGFTENQIRMSTIDKRIALNELITDLMEAELTGETPESQ